MCVQRGRALVARCLFIYLFIFLLAPAGSSQGHCKYAFVDHGLWWARVRYVRISYGSTCMPFLYGDVCFFLFFFARMEIYFQDGGRNITSPHPHLGMLTSSGITRIFEHDPLQVNPNTVHVVCEPDSGEALQSWVVILVRLSNERFGDVQYFPLEYSVQNTT